MRLCLLGTLLLALTSALPAHAACSRPLKVVISPLGYSYFIDRDGKGAGVVPDLIRELSKRSGCTLTLLERPRARAIVEFSNGQVDVLTSAIQSPERDAMGHYVHYAFTQLDLLLAPMISATGLLDWARQSNFRLGVVRGVFMGPVITASVDQLRALNRVDEAADYDNLVQRLNAGRVQGALFPSMIHLKLRDEGALDPQVRTVPIADAPPSPIGFYFHSKSMTEADRQQIEPLLRRMLRDGSTERIYARYIGQAAAARLFTATPRSGKH